MRMQKSKKAAILAVSVFIGIAAYLGAHAYFAKDLTQWQNDQEMNLQQETGSTKLKAYTDSLTAGGLAFAVSAAALFAYFKRSATKSEGGRHGKGN